MKTHSQKNLKNAKGFTLIELLIVIAIIGILAAVAFPQFAQYRSRSFGNEFSWPEVFSKIVSRFVPAGRDKEVLSEC